jgi:hypothetical protein
MLSRNDNPNINGFNFGVDSVFNEPWSGIAFVPPPPIESDFLLTDGTNFLLTDGTNFLLAGT